MINTTIYEVLVRPSRALTGTNTRGGGAGVSPPVEMTFRRSFRSSSPHKRSSHLRVGRWMPCFQHGTWFWEPCHYRIFLVVSPDRATNGPCRSLPLALAQLPKTSAPTMPHPYLHGDSLPSAPERPPTSRTSKHRSPSQCRANPPGTT